MPPRILPVIALAQLGGTSLWFAANAVVPDLERDWQLDSGTAAAAVTTAVQAGFIIGTLVYSLLLIADRFSPRKVYLVSSLMAAAANAAVLLMPAALASMTGTRFAVGFLLAGIYPVGMKIAASWYREGLGGALGVLIGALVLGAAVPQGLRAAGADWPWEQVILTVSGFAAAGGLLLAWQVPDGPHRVRGTALDPRSLVVIVRDPTVRASVFGYFGHMWELYVVLMLIPALFALRLGGPSATVAWLSFAAIGVGAIGCAGGGWLAGRFGSARVASVQLLASGLCCLLAPWMFVAPWWLFVAWMMVWGTTVSGDSPQFSALTANNCPPEIVGSVLTFVNCIGFTISIVAIQWATWAAGRGPLETVLPWLAVGPAIGLLFMRRLVGTAPRSDRPSARTGR